MDSGEVVLVTGANTGLGFQIITALYASERAYTILLAGRSISKAEAAVKSAQDAHPSSRSKLCAIQVDIEDDDSIKTAFENVQSRFGRLDILINNAGAQLDQQLAAGRMTMREMWAQSWNVNTAGTQVMTATFAALLVEAARPRVLFITSGTSALAGSDDVRLAVNRSPPKGWPKAGLGGDSYDLPAYRASKTALNMVMREWHRTLKADGVLVWCVSPGQLATGLGGSREVNRSIGGGDPAVAGEFVRSVVEGARDADVGKVILRDGVQPW